MDNLTHTLSGLVVARLSPASALPTRTRYLAGALAANAPDLDIVLAPLSSQLYLLHHRGETHSLLLLPLWAWLLSWLFSRVFSPRAAWRDYYALTALALLAHVFGDWITSYGTQLFAPLTNRTYALGTTFIIDPVLTLILLAGFAASVWQAASTRPAWLTSLAVVVWIATQYLYKQEAIEAGIAHARTQGWGNLEVRAEARPLAPFNWTVLIREGDRYHYAHLRLNATAAPTPGPEAHWLVRALAAFRPLAQADWHTVPVFGNADDDMLARDIWARPEFEFFRWFASAPALYRIDHQPHGPCVWFQDLRFVAPGRDGPFRFGLCAPDWRTYRLGRDGAPVAFD